MSSRNRVAVLSHSSSWYLRDLQRGGKKLGIEVTGIDFRDIAIHLGKNSDHPFQNIDAGAVIVRTMPMGSLEQVIFRMDALRHWENEKRIVINSAIGLETAIDKSLTLIRFQQNDVPFPTTGVFQSADRATQFFEMHRDIVVKPVFGGEGRGLIRVKEAEIAYRIFTSLERSGSVIYCQRFVENIKRDIRIFVLGNDCFAVERQNAGSWISNAAAGGTQTEYQPSPYEIDLAKRAATAVDTAIAGVDLLVNEQGEYFVIEVNAVPGWKAISKTLNIDFAEKILAYVNDLQP